LAIAPTPCPPSLQADVPVVPDVPDDAGIVKPPVGSKAATATGVYLDYVARLNDMANVLRQRAVEAKAYCEAR
jgi:hypothetical protein